MKWIALLVVWFSLPLLAAERPVLPEPGEDTVLFKGRTAREFFQARADVAACRPELAKTGKIYGKERALLQKLIKEQAEADAIDAQEARMEEARRHYLAKVQECGNCAARETERLTIHGAERTEVWYVSDGSCQLDTHDKDQLKAAFERATDHLLHPKRYKRTAGGFPHVLETLWIDPATGKVKGDVEKLVSPSEHYISIKGRDLLGTLTAFSYYFNSTFKEIVQGERRELVLDTVSKRMPRGFQPPEVYDISASGMKKRRVTQIRLSNVIAQWYLSSDGYIRYFTAGDFGIQSKFLEEMGQEILLTTVHTLQEKSLEAKP